MTPVMADPERRAERLLRWYPKSWRARYGDEFTELLCRDVSEHPRSWRRTVDVVGSGLLARMTSAGLSAHDLAPSDQIRASLASLGCALAVFVVLGGSMWSQLTIGWQWARPNSVGTTAAMVVMSVAMLVFLVLAVLAALPVTGTVLAQLFRRRGAGIGRPLVLMVLGAGLLIVGARHFGNGWPGTGGHPWAHQGLVPGGVAAFWWASTLSISSYWAHPGTLLHFPADEVVWMVMSPLAMISVVVGATKILRRLELSPAVLRYERRLGHVAAMAMTAFLVGSALWVVDGGPGPRNLFHAGAIDVGALVVMTGVSLVALRSVQRARSAPLSLLSR